MVLLKNSVALAAIGLLSLSTPVMAEDYHTNYNSRSDLISLSAGDAAQANIAIQHPTPWPSYVDDTHIHTPARIGVSALENMFKRYEGASSAGPSTVINIGKQ
jgi:hypothetical protein